MNRKQLTHHLFQLTETEKFALENQGYQQEYTYQTTKSDPGESVYIFDFETHHKSRRKRYAHTGSFLDDTQIEIIKHARFSKTPMHIHSYIEMTYVFSGSVKSIINNKEITLCEGHICLLDPNVPHTILEASEDDIIINFLMSKKYFSTTMLNRLSNNSIIFNFLIGSLSNIQQQEKYILLDCKENIILKEIIENILCEYFDPNIFSKDIIDSYMVVVFSELIRTFQRQNSIATNNHMQTNLGNILQYIEDCDGLCTLQEVAEHFSFNSNYLSRLIKKQLGRNFKDLIQEFRFNKACTLLRTTSLSIEEIANQIGYSNIGFFYQKFNTLYFCSPKEYRDKTKE